MFKLKNIVRVPDLPTETFEIEKPEIQAAVRSTDPQPKPIKPKEE